MKSVIIIAIAFVLLIPSIVFADEMYMYTISDTGIDIFTDKVHYSTGETIKLSIRADTAQFNDEAIIGITTWDSHKKYESEQFRVTPGQTLIHEIVLDDGWDGQIKMYAKASHTEICNVCWDEYYFFVDVSNPTDEDFSHTEYAWSNQETNPKGYYLYAGLADPDAKSDAEIQAREEILDPCTNIREPQVPAEYQGDAGLNDPVFMKTLRDAQSQYFQQSQQCYREYQILIDQRVAELEEPEIVCGTGTIEKNGQCVPDYPNTEPSSKGGGCLIATATYGSELAPQVQQLRELRDNKLLQTESGTSFINSFNDFYYSFSPYIADYERENPLFKEIVKMAITPMITSLSILNYVDMDSDFEVLGYGISLIVLNGMMYVGIPVIVILKLRK